MVNKLAMSLDDIIQSDESLRNLRDEGSARRDRRQPLHRRGRPVDNQRDTQHHRSVLRDRNHGGIQKPKHHRSAWKHDTRTYNGPKYDYDRPVSSRFIPVPSKLLITNLDYGTSESEIYQLLTRAGHPNSVSLHRDNCGYSLGSAVVIFERTADAERAVKQFNGVQLNGQRMEIQFKEDEATRRPQVGMVCRPSTSFSHSHSRRHDAPSPTRSYTRKDNSISSRQRSPTRSYTRRNNSSSSGQRSSTRSYRHDSGTSRQRSLSKSYNRSRQRSPTRNYTRRDNSISSGQRSSTMSYRHDSGSSIQRSLSKSYNRSRQRSPTRNYTRRDNSISSGQRSSTMSYRHDSGSSRQRSPSKSYNNSRQRSPPRKKYRMHQSPAAGDFGAELEAYIRARKLSDH